MKNLFTFFIALIELSIFSGNAQEEVMKVHALQVNFHEFNANIFGRKSGLKHQFLIESSEGEMNTSPSPASASSERATEKLPKLPKALKCEDRRTEEMLF